MYFQFHVQHPVLPPAGEPPAAPVSMAETVDLLRQILEVQREQLVLLRQSAAAHDVGARWRAFLSRWQQDFPDLGGACRKSLPILERCYGKMIADLTEKLCEDGDEALDNDFALQEFLDRYGMRLVQLGSILNQVAPLAEAGSQGEST
jgi:hypothetical protein